MTTPEDVTVTQSQVSRAPSPDPAIVYKDTNIQRGSSGLGRLTNEGIWKQIKSVARINICLSIYIYIQMFKHLAGVVTAMVYL